MKGERIYATPPFLINLLTGKSRRKTNQILSELKNGSLYISKIVLLEAYRYLREELLFEEEEVLAAIYCLIRSEEVEVEDKDLIEDIFRHPDEIVHDLAETLYIREALFKGMSLKIVKEYM